VARSHLSSVPASQRLSPVARPNVGSWRDDLITYAKNVWRLAISTGVVMEIGPGQVTTEPFAMGVLLCDSTEWTSIWAGAAGSIDTCARNETQTRLWVSLRLSSGETVRNTGGQLTHVVQIEVDTPVVSQTPAQFRSSL
jgi:hypothetical protein